MVNKRKPAVLIVDNQPNWRKALSFLLEDEYEITTVASHEEALDALLRQEPPFHLAIVEIRLVVDSPTNEDGLRLIARLNRTGEHTNAIVLTEYPSLQTIKTAFRDLDVFDYVEKKPDNGAFDSNRFRKIVRDAVDDSQKRRFVRATYRVLVIEEDETRREKFLKILKADGYEVDSLATRLDLVKKLRTQTYSLLLISATFLSQDRQILFKIRQHQPNAQIILMTETEISQIMEALQNREIQTAITINDDRFDSQHFREVVRRSFAPEATKYVTGWFFEGPKKREKLQVGQSYVLALSMYDALNIPYGFKREALSIWLPPKGEKRSKTLLSVLVIAPKMKVENDDEGKAYWEVPERVRPSPLKMEITPTTAGLQKVYIDIDHGLSWLGRLEKEVEVVPASMLEAG